MIKKFFSLDFYSAFSAYDLHAEESTWFGNVEVKCVGDVSLSDLLYTKHSPCQDNMCIDTSYNAVLMRDVIVEYIDVLTQACDLEDLLEDDANPGDTLIARTKIVNSTNIDAELENARRKGCQWGANAWMDELAVRNDDEYGIAITLGRKATLLAPVRFQQRDVVIH